MDIIGGGRMGGAGDGAGATERVEAINQYFEDSISLRPERRVSGNSHSE